MVKPVMIMSKVISKDDKVNYQRWQAPTVSGELSGGPNGGVKRPAASRNKSRMSKAQQQGYDEGFSAGRNEGHVQGLRDGQAQFQTLINALSHSFDEMDEIVVQELAKLSLTISRQLLRREIKTEPGEVVAVVREALTILAANSNQAKVYLHPEDAALVRSALMVAENDASWSVVEDPALTRGGCRVSTEVSYIDASIEARIAEIGAHILGGERVSDDHND